MRGRNFGLVLRKSFKLKHLKIICFPACFPSHLYSHFWSVFKNKELDLFSAAQEGGNVLKMQNGLCVSHSVVSLCNLRDCSLPGFSFHGILQARILEWVIIPFSRGSNLSLPHCNEADSLPSEPTGKQNCLGCVLDIREMSLHVTLNFCTFSSNKQFLVAAGRLSHIPRTVDEREQCMLLCSFPCRRPSSGGGMMNCRTPLGVTGSPGPWLSPGVHPPPPQAPTPMSLSLSAGKGPSIPR